MSAGRATALEWIEQGRKAYASGNFHEAAQFYKRALASQPETAENREILLALSNAYDELNMHEDALHILQELLDEHRDFADAWNNLGIICQKLGKLDEAYEAFERALALAPENVRILINLGSVALKRGDPGTAKQLLELSLELDATQPLAYANLALTMLLFGRIEEAEEQLRLAVFHGFQNAEPIQTRIERMKQIRAGILHKHEKADPEPQPQGAEESIKHDDALELLAVLEKELFRLVEQLNRSEADQGREKEELQHRVEELMSQVQALRLAVGAEDIRRLDLQKGRDDTRESI